MAASAGTALARETLRERAAKAQQAIDEYQERQRGVTPTHAAILEGVYEMEKKPDKATEARLAQQLSLDPLAVAAWFRARRVRSKRFKYSRYRLYLLLALTLVGLCLTLWQFSYIPEMRRTMKHFTRSGRPHVYPPSKKARMQYLFSEASRRAQQA